MKIELFVYLTQKRRMGEREEKERRESERIIRAEQMTLLILIT